ncbi:MAG: hypothetical protein OXE86_09295 [Alphaproteobacteria bacterium]|nr:hypothetical protein [Alphaproteobacteria bacterium]
MTDTTPVTIPVDMWEADLDVLDALCERCCEQDAERPSRSEVLRWLVWSAYSGNLNRRRELAAREAAGGFE